jgi:hypothetical protein
MKPAIKPLTLLTILIVLTACAPTRAQVIEEYAEPFTHKRDQLIAIAQSLPPVGSVTENSYCDSLDPPLIMKDKYPDQEYTAAMLMYEQLLDPDIDLYEQMGFDVSIGADLVTALRWTGPKNPMASSARKGRDGDFADELENALAYPYLVVNRIEEYIPAEIIKDSQFLPGYVAIEGFVVSFETNEILCSYRVEAVTSADTVKYNLKSRSDGKSAESALQWALESDARRAIQDTLNEITGGTVEYATLPDNE